jgi:hypothetical protein
MPNVMAHQQLDKLLEPVRDGHRDLPIQRVFVEDYVDSVGEEELRVWVLFPDDTPDDLLRWDRLQPVDVEIVRRLNEAGESRFPYVRFATEREYAGRFDPAGADE